MPQILILNLGKQIDKQLYTIYSQNPIYINTNRKDIYRKYNKVSIYIQPNIYYFVWLNYKLQKFALFRLVKQIQQSISKIFIIQQFIKPLKQATQKLYYHKLQTIKHNNLADKNLQQMQHSPQHNFSSSYQMVRKPSINYEQDSGFKAWDSDSIAVQQGTNLFRNLKSQLVNYQQKFKRLNIKTLPIKLPTLDVSTKNPHIKKQNLNSKSKVQQQKNNAQTQQQKPLTQRKNSSINKKSSNLLKNRSIQSYKKSDSSLSKQQSSTKLKEKNRKNTIQLAIIKQDKPLFITKIQQMKFSENQQKRIRKRDIYLSIFGERGKGKVQKLTFDDENKPYQMYLQRKNQLTKMTASINMPYGQEIAEGFVKQSGQPKGKRCISQLNNRYNKSTTSQNYSNGCFNIDNEKNSVYPQAMRF